MGDRLRSLWDFGDLDSTERRLRVQLADETSDPGRAEVLAELARVEGLRGRFDEGDRLLDEAQTHAGSATPRTQLERGRLRRSGGDRAAAYPLFEAAYSAALEDGDEYVAVDAAHMAALAAPDREAFERWTRQGLRLAEASGDSAVGYWAGPLLNNLGWELFAAGEYEHALNAFERALEARERDPERQSEIEIARYAVAKTLRALGKPEDAVQLLEQAVAWTSAVGRPDGWFHEELAEAYAALGRDEEARAQARLAVPLLTQADPAFEADGDRAARLDRLAT
jgi:tetratricopeptide (TPR) repeat protein